MSFDEVYAAFLLLVLTAGVGVSIKKILKDDIELREAQTRYTESQGPREGAGG
jgi:hypothetical protein